MALQQLLQLEADFQRKGSDQSWNEEAILVLVACCLHRVAGPLRWFFQLVQAVKRNGLLRHTQGANVQVRIVDAVTGPTSEHTHILFHRRFCNEADMYKGNQSNERRYYVAVTRARLCAAVWLDSEPFGTEARARRSHLDRGSHVSGRRFHHNLQKVVWQQKLPYRILQPGGWHWDNHSNLPGWITGTTNSLISALVGGHRNAQVSMHHQGLVPQSSGRTGEMFPPGCP